jgi:probable rRNA maturation factor
VIVQVASEHPRGSRIARRLESRAIACLSALGREDAELSILVVTDGRIRGLNRRWRGKDRATDVLSFPISEPPGSGSLLGDVVLSLDTATRRARAEKRSTAAELDRYLVHGILHLLGYDHELPEDARAMAAKEAELARAEGLVGAALRKGGRDGRGRAAEERWTRSPTSISTPSRSGSTARGTRAKTSRTASRR